MNNDEAKALGRWCEQHQQAYTRVHLPNGIHVTGCRACVEGSQLATLDPAALWEACEKAKADRAERMPDDESALCVLHDAYTRIKELGWRDAAYAPKDGTEIQVIEAGSTGIHSAAYFTWVGGGGFFIDGEWPSRPILFRDKILPSESTPDALLTL